MNLQNTGMCIYKVAKEVKVNRDTVRRFYSMNEGELACEYEKRRKTKEEKARDSILEARRQKENRAFARMIQVEGRLSYTKLAKIVGVSKQVFSEYATGDYLPRERVMQSIFREFNVPCKNLADVVRMYGNNDTSR